MVEARPIIGCCDWTDRTPDDVLPASGQPHSQAVEISRPPEFCFCIKDWQLITHTLSSPTYRRLNRASARINEISTAVSAPLNRYGWRGTHSRNPNILDAHVIVLQCPKSFLSTSENTCNLSKFFKESTVMIAYLPVNRGVMGMLFTGGFTAGWANRDQYTDEDLAELATKLNARSHLSGAKGKRVPSPGCTPRSSRRFALQEALAAPRDSRANRQNRWREKRPELRSKRGSLSVRRQFVGHKF